MWSTSNSVYYVGNFNNTIYPMLLFTAQDKWKWRKKENTEELECRIHIIRAKTGNKSYTSTAREQLTFHRVCGTLPCSAAGLSRQGDKNSMFWGTLKVMGWDGGHRFTEVSAGHIAIVASTHLRAASQLSGNLVIVSEPLSHILTGRGGDTLHLATTSVKERHNSHFKVCETGIARN